MKSYPAYKHSGVPWLGEIPEHWGTKRAKYLFALLGRPVEPHHEVITCFRDGTVTLRKNRRLTGFTESLTEVGYQGVKKGDLVIHQMDAFAGAVGISDSDGKTTPVCSVCSSKVELSKPYFAYIIRRMASSNFILSLAKGIRQRSTDFRFATFARCVLPVPPLSEQAAIASYLDRKCGEIDEMVRRRQAIIERLRELKQALIAKAVTKGLHPDVPMKDSGIPWLGQIPEGWSVQPLKYMFSFRKGLPITKADLIDEGLPVISYGQVHSRDNSGTRLTEQLLRYVSPDYAVSYPNAAVPINSFIFADTSEDLEGCGNCVYNDSMPNLFAGYHSIILNTISRNSARYLAYLFKSDTWRKQIRTAVSGVKVFSISRRILKACSLLVPPLPEQSAIVAYLDQKCAAIDELISRHGQIVEKLRELKASTIAHVVTGKIDIRERA